ncbi:hypothetical protein MWU59_07830 [Flavobacteriaceae bacterium F08102]|nr:hypothetical protein [Flavobacteriaceae bacterium F08102]
MTPFKNQSTSDLRGWVKIGEQTVSDGRSYDEIEILEENKNVKRLKIKVLKKAIYIASVKVIYEGNTSEAHNINRVLDKGKSSEAFNLIGHYRVIEKVFVTYGQPMRTNNKHATELVVLAKM